jgi:hypothetical protein
VTQTNAETKTFAEVQMTSSTRTSSPTSTRSPTTPCRLRRRDRRGQIGARRLPIPVYDSINRVAKQASELAESQFVDATVLNSAKKKAA